MIIRHVQKSDKEFWFKLDKHLSENELDNKIRDKMGYVLLENNTPIAILRYNLFWDNIPFCTMLFVTPKYQHKGYGRNYYGILGKRNEIIRIRYGYGFYTIR